MITAPALSDTIASDAHDLRDAYPKGATPHDLAGWYAVPLPRIEEALATLREEGADLSFMRQEPEKNPAAVAMGQRGGRARAEKVAASRRSEIAQRAAAARWAAEDEPTEGFNNIIHGMATAPQPDRASLAAFKRDVKANGGFLNYDMPAFKEAQKRGPYKMPGPDDDTPPEVRLRLIKMIPKLAKSYPDGITVPHLMAELDTTEHRVRYALNQARNEGWCDIIRERTEANGQRQIYLFTGMMKRAPDLTVRQGEVYAWLQKHADGGEVTAQMNQICRDLGIADGTVFGHLYSIERKGYTERITGYNDRVNGIRVSPRFKLLDLPKPTTVELRNPHVKANVERPPIEPEFLATLRARRQLLEREMDKIDALLSVYDDA